MGIPVSTIYLREERGGRELALSYDAWSLPRDPIHLGCKKTLPTKTYPSGRKVDQPMGTTWDDIPLAGRWDNRKLPSGDTITSYMALCNTWLDKSARLILEWGGVALFRVKIKAFDPALDSEYEADYKIELENYGPANKRQAAILPPRQTQPISNIASIKAQIAALNATMQGYPVGASPSLFDTLLGAVNAAQGAIDSVYSTLSDQIQRGAQWASLARRAASTLQSAQAQCFSVCAALRGATSSGFDGMFDYGYPGVASLPAAALWCHSADGQARSTGASCLAAVMALLQTAAAGPCSGVYRVRTGDTIQLIASLPPPAGLGDWTRWQEIADLNNIPGAGLTGITSLRMPAA